MRELSAHEVRTVPQEGWAGLKDGELLSRATGRFEVFVTVDQNLAYQQNLSGYRIGVVVLRVAANRLADLIPLVPDLLQAVETIRPGELVHVG